MSTETTEAPEAQTNNEMPSPMQETPSTVENVPQDNPDFASWLSDRLDNFQKGQETPPWEESKEEPNKDSETEQKPKSTDDAGEKATTEDAEESADKEEEVSEEDTSDDSEADDIKNMSATAGTKFKELKTELKTYKSRVSELEETVKQLQESPSDPAEVKQMQEKLQAYEQEISVARVEASQQYKQAVTEPTELIFDAVASLAERYKVDARKLVGALREESAAGADGSDALVEIAGDFSERDRVRLYRMADDLSEVSQRREYLRANAVEARQELEQRESQAEKERMLQMKSEMEASVNNTWNEVFKSKPFIAALDAKVIDETHTAAKAVDFFQAPPEERAYAVYSGLLLPHIAKELEAVKAKASEYEKALSKYKKASPKASGDSPSVASVKSDVGFLDAIEERFSQ